MRVRRRVQRVVLALLLLAAASSCASFTAAPRPSAAPATGAGSGTSPSIGTTTTPTTAPGTTTPTTAPDPAPSPGPDTPVQRWLADTPRLIAHRGGSADWPECTAFAYAQAAAWNPDLALEVPVWQTADGVWVVSHDRSTLSEFGVDEDITTTDWATLSTLRSTDGGLPMARLVEDVLSEIEPDRVVFVDDKSDQHVPELFDVLDAHGGGGRFVVKAFWQSVAMPTEARARGYLTWGYWYAADMGSFTGSEQRFDLLALETGAPASDFAVLLATGKPVFGHIVTTPDQAADARAKGATGLMVAAVQEVVPRR